MPHDLFSQMIRAVILVVSWCVLLLPEQESHMSACICRSGSYLYIICFAVLVTVWLSSGVRKFSKSGRHLSILCVSRLPWNMSHTEDSQILDATVQNEATLKRNDVLVIRSLYCAEHVEDSTDWHNILMASCVCVRVDKWRKGRLMLNLPKATSKLGMTTTCVLITTCYTLSIVFIGCLLAKFHIRRSKDSLSPAKSRNLILRFTKMALQ